MVVPPDESRQRPDNISSQLIPKPIAGIIIVVGVSLLAYVVVRNEPFREPFFVQIIRVILALAAGVVASYLPGYFGFSQSGGGNNLSTAGAIGFAVLVFWATPVVAPNLSADNIERPPPPVIRCRAWTATEYLRELSVIEESRDLLESRRVEWLRFVLTELSRNVSEKRLLVIAESEPFPDPFPGFSAWVDTFPEESVDNSKHDVYAFMVRRSGPRKSFTPIPAMYVRDYHKTLLAVPESKRGDYILIMLVLSGDQFPAKGGNIPVDLKPI